MKDEFQNVVRNALDFLNEAVADLSPGEGSKAKTKFAVINFFSGLELFLKARLLADDWRHCVASSTTTEEDFKSGNFKSIGLDAAKKRLSELPSGQLNTEEYSVFDRLRQRRNKAVHFYHPDHLQTAEKVAVEQLVGWSLLFRRLTKVWKDHFAEFEEELAILDQKMKTRSDYFPVVFSYLSEEIDRQAASRARCLCSTCQQDSSLSEGEIVTGLHRMSCRVCESGDARVLLPCRNPDCYQPVEREFSISHTCGRCSEIHENDVAENFRHFGPEGLGLEPVAWCGMCGYTVSKSVARIPDGCFCIACHAVLDSWRMRHCEWCNTLVTGPAGDRLNPGGACCQRFICYDEQNEVPPDFLFDAEVRKNNIQNAEYEAYMQRSAWM